MPVRPVVSSSSKTNGGGGGAARAPFIPTQPVMRQPSYPEPRLTGSRYGYPYVKNTLSSLCQNNST